jgi:hypothetical protein
MNDHHLILGELTDCITGETLTDTHDERYRQKIARLLLEEKGFAREGLIPRYPLTIKAGGKCARIPVTLLARINSKMAMLVQYGPGSLTTRQRPALAMGRLVAPYQIPVVVVTNGQQAEILDGASGEQTAAGLNNLPDHDQLVELAAAAPWLPINARRAEMESRILFAFEVDDRCSCDDTVCQMGSTP